MTTLTSIPSQAAHSDAAQPATARPWKVLLVTEAAGAGVGRHFLDLAKGLAARGVDVEGVYSKGRIDEQFAARLATGDYPPMAELDMRRSVGLHDLRSARALTQYIEQHGPYDLIHAHSSKAGAIVRWAVWRKPVPVVYTPHAFITLDPELASTKRLVFGLAERAMARRQRQRIIAVGHREAEHARTLGIPAEMVHVVINGVSTPAGPTREELRRQWQVPEDAVVVGFVGRFTHQKSPLRLVEMMRALAARHPRLRLAMVGSGPLENELRQQFRQLGVESQVLWLGPVDGAVQMRGFDLFCLTSLYEAGMSYVVLEALEAGLPVVATSAGDVATIIKNDVNGICVPLKDTSALIAAVDRVVGDDAFRQQLASAAQTCRGEYSVERMVTETLAVYAELLRVPRQN
jgi:glycosyltransferase involved in cell wall biosynthesis